VKQFLREYLEKTVVTCHYPITLAGDKPNTLNRWLVKSRWVEGSAAGGTAPCLEPGGRILAERELGVLSNEELESNWRYYFADEPYFLGDQRTFYEYVHFYKLFTSNADKYLYGLCNVFCNQAGEFHFFIYAVSPIKLWVNGELVFTSSLNYFIRPYRLIVRLREGDNTVLVEQSVFKNDRARQWNPGEFTIRIHPCRFLSDSHLNRWIDQWVIDDLRSRLAIIPDRAFYPVESVIKMVILPGYFLGTEPEPVKVTISNATKSIIKELIVDTGREFTVEIGPKDNGLLRVQAETMTGATKKANVYLFRGVFTAARNMLIKRARESRNFSESIIQNFIRTTEIFDINTGFFKGSRELILSEYYYVVFEKYWEFEIRVNSGAGSPPKSVFDVYKDNAFIFMDSDIDQGYFTYQIALPANYSAAKKYPLVIFLNYGLGLSQYPDLVLERYPERQHFAEAIMVNAPARGGLNRDYINESNYFKMINDIREQFSIDRERIYLIGSCTGGIEAASLALKAPHLFAAVVIAWGTPRLDLNNPDYEYLKNMNQMVTYHLLNIDDYSFNFSRLWDTQKQFPKSRSWNYYNLSHIEIDAMVDYRRLIHELIDIRAESYPRAIEFMVDEPVFNRSYWLMVNRIDDLHHKGRIKAQIIGSNRIEVITQNIGRFSIYANQEALGLEPEVELYINGIQSRLWIADFGRLDVELNGNESRLEYHGLSPESFGQEYGRIGINEDLLGIKRIYTGKCLLIKPDPSPEAAQTLLKRLLKLLQLPMKERTRNYKYDSCLESKVIPDDLRENNFIIVVDARNISPMQHQILNSVGLEPKPEGMDYLNHQYSGAYFALIKCPNPNNPGRYALLVIYNTDLMVEELINFWNTFDYNNCFFGDAIVYHQGLYISFRESNGRCFPQSGGIDTES
jgi:pimeloyl-ACP methyl ester carboxylesterase